MPPICLVCKAPGARFWARAEDVEYRTSQDVFTFYQCSACGVLFIDPVPDDRLEEIYPSNYYSYGAPAESIAYRVKRWLDKRSFRTMLGQIPGDRLRALDVGGGAGWELSTLRAADARVQDTTIVDLDPQAAQIAEQNGHRYVCSRIEDYQATEPYDVILLLNLIEHVRTPVNVLSKARTLLSPAGFIVVKTPNYDALDARIFRHRSWAGYHCPRHWVLFTKASFSLAAGQAGLAVHTAKYTQGAPFWAASTLAMLASGGIVRVTRERPVFFHPLFGPLLAAFGAFDLLRLPLARTSQMVFVLQHPR